MGRSVLVGAAAVALVTACGGDDGGDPPRGPAFDGFERVTDTCGIDFQYATPDFRGGGLAVADLDGDDLPEVVTTSRLGGVAVYRNRGGMRFERVAGGAGLDETAVVQAVAAADLDGDGDRDLVLAGNGRAVVMANAGDGTFAEAARFVDSGFTEQVLPVDLNGDGLLDLYFANHDLGSVIATADRVYLNAGELAFTGVTLPERGPTWAASAFDMDGDGDVDVYAANDTLLADYGHPVDDGMEARLPPDVLFRNDGAGSDGVVRVVDIAKEMGVADPRSSMGGLVGDFDDDGVLDLYVPNEGAKKLFLGRGGGAAFVESAAALGLQATSRVNGRCEVGTEDRTCLLLSWAAVFGDFDLDGYDEIVMTNGLEKADEPPPVLMFARGAAVGYHEVSPNLRYADARGVVATDLDGDGDLDVAMTVASGSLEVYATRGAPRAGSWLRVVLHGVASNREGIGAVVTARFADGHRVMRVVGAGGVLNTSAPAEVVFGEGASAVEELAIRWPSGVVQTVASPGSGTVVVDEP